MLNKFKKSDYCALIKQHIWYWINRNETKKLLIKESRKKKTQLQFPKKVGLVFHGTENYIKLFPLYYKTLSKYFLPNTQKEFFVMTNRIDFNFLKTKENINIVPSPHNKMAQLKAYEYMCNAIKRMLV